MTNDDEFFAWLDGELAPADAARVEARVAADPALCKQASAHRLMAANLRAAFTSTMTPKDNVVDLSARRARTERMGGVRPRLPQWAAIAATLVTGVGLGTVASTSRESGSPVSLVGGHMVAAAALDRTLTQQLASVDQRGEATRVVLTFRNGQGHLCRTFTGGVVSGLACRDGDNWRIEGLFGAGGQTAGAYRTAAGEDPRLATLVEDMIAGDPLDAVAEAKARKDGWR